MRLLLVSNSTNAGEQYPGYPKDNIKAFPGNHAVKALFILNVSVTFSFAI
jgi:dipeptidase E